MHIITSPTEIRRHLAGARVSDRIALVPTMGCLHEGHLSLIRRARKLADIVVVSIYVNPLQFGPNEDLDAYPRTFEEDAASCEAAGVDVIFHPESLYPEDGPLVSMKVSRLDACLCGASRPGHFDGVATVVGILFHVVQPDVAVFGEKDWQQLTIIRRMVQDQHFPIDIVGVETVREDDGLAMSSRNRYLNREERQKAAALSAALDAMQRRAASGESDAEALLQTGLGMLNDAGISPEYLEIRDAWHLTPVEHLRPERPARAFVAARIGRARLIDNVPLNPPLNPTQTPEEVTR